MSSEVEIDGVMLLTWPVIARIRTPKTTGLRQKHSHKISNFLSTQLCSIYFFNYFNHEVHLLRRIPSDRCYCLRGNCVRICPTSGFNYSLHPHSCFRTEYGFWRRRREKDTDTREWTRGVFLDVRFSGDFCTIEYPEILWIVNLQQESSIYYLINPPACLYLYFSPTETLTKCPMLRNYPLLLLALPSFPYPSLPVWSLCTPPNK